MLPQYQNLLTREAKDDDSEAPNSFKSPKSEKEEVKDDEIKIEENRNTS